ncbi:MAG: M1 family aminopeptidase [Kofleriaceae bacterium]
MRTLLAIAGFELRARVRRLSTWVYFAVFFALAVLWTAAAGGAFANASVSYGSEKVWINAPMALMATVGVLAVMALPVISSMLGRAVQQDFEYRTESAFFSSPITKGQYLGGRLLAALASIVVVLASIALGVAFGVQMPFVQADRVGAVGLLPYLWPYLVIVLPNLLVLGAIFFSLGALTRRMLPVYITSAVLLVGYILGTSLAEDHETRTLASLLDPFGVTAVQHLTKYWPVAERNTRLVPLAGELLLNRALWTGLALLVLGLCYRRFTFTHAGGARAANAKDASTAPSAPAAASSDGRWKQAAEAGPRWLAALGALTWLQFRETVKNVYFGVIVLTGVLFVAATSFSLDDLYGTSTYPVTYKMLDLVGGQFGIFVLILITFYSGELVWRERDAHVDQLHDAMPVPTGLLFGSKLAALLLVPVVMQVVVMVTGMILQVLKGYTHVEPGLYLRHLFGIQLLHYWGLCALAFVVQVLVNHKYLGHFVMVLYFIAMTFAEALGFEHRLLHPFQAERVVYSDMNGYGHLLPKVRWLQLTWGAAALGLLTLARLFWQRGTVVGWRSRLVVARSRLTRPVLAAATLALLAGSASAAYVYYNTNVLNRYVPNHRQEDDRAAYEKAYRARLLALPLAKVTAVEVHVDLFPSTQRVHAKGTFTLTNKTAQPLSELWVNHADPELVPTSELALDRPAEVIVDDARFGLRGYRLQAPLAPGAQLRLAFDVTAQARGFRNGAPATEVVHNGSFINSAQLLPRFGYREELELVSDNARKEHGLPHKDRMRARTDPSGLARSYLSGDSDWITFEAVVSTEPDQLAIAPGYLQREWREGDRRYFHYKMDSPILNFYAFLSARYQVLRDRWNDVAIEIYYHPGHAYNLPRMIASTKDSLAYFTKAFGPYQHRQFRILEFPRYAQFAQSFPNTIPYSEAIGFLARVDDQDDQDLDYPYYVTSHELAHQWWAHQVIGANVQGATVLSETLSQYSALMVMKHKYGDAKMKRFLRYELDRYLLGRSREQKREVPLARVENQPYIHYAKGSLVMYALQDYLGEERVNAAIKAFRDQAAYQGPPYPTTLELVAQLRAAAPPELRPLVEDLFEQMVFYESRALSASARALPGGRYEVTLRVKAKKVRADELGAETEVALDDPIEIGVMGADGPLYLEKRRVPAGESEVKVEVHGRPVTAGIDPLNKLIDRTPGDNTIGVEL